MNLGKFMKLNLIIQRDDITPVIIMLILKSDVPLPTIALFQSREDTDSLKFGFTHNNANAKLFLPIFGWIEIFYYFFQIYFFRRIYLHFHKLP